MCRVVRKHGLIYHPDYRKCDIKLTKEEDIQAANELLKMLRKVINTSIKIEDKRLGPFDTKPEAQIVANVLNGRAAQIRTYNNRGEPVPKIEEFMKRHYLTFNGILQ